MLDFKNQSYKKKRNLLVFSLQVNLFLFLFVFLIIFLYLFKDEQQKFISPYSNKKNWLIKTWKIINLVLSKQTCVLFR